MPPLGCQPSFPLKPHRPSPDLPRSSSGEHSLRGRGVGPDEGRASSCAHGRAIGTVHSEPPASSEGGAGLGCEQTGAWRPEPLQPSLAVASYTAASQLWCPVLASVGWGQLPGVCRALQVAAVTQKRTSSGQDSGCGATDRGYSDSSSRGEWDVCSHGSFWKPQNLTWPPHVK
ncbi:hypothetical protein P7K49_003246 [Saguinus oedipus]|uniref:Uncharacterized protein n=1 Tax=Saguinus oedipus TaxID=9490 RepID=A0ABQ9WK26_SAGOE|nr:hypothetical protein P7K49_003246 [Saguinus oedipus]